MSEFGKAASNRPGGRPGASEDGRTVESDPVPMKRPWYFSTTVVALAYFLFSPLGSLLILTDRRRGKKAKIRAVAVLLFSLSLLTYRVFFMPPIHL